MSLRSLRGPLAVAALAALALPVSVPAHAATITYSFTDTTNGEDATGTLVDNGTNDVLTLTNNLSDPGSVVGAISGVILTFSTNLGTVSLTSQTSGSGDLITITGKTGGKNGSPGSGSTFAGNPDNWTSATSAKTLTLSTNHDDHNPGEICATGAPCDLIVGPGPYTNSDSSFGSHDPSVYLSAIFDLSGLTGLTLSSAEFLFGTSNTPGAVIDPTVTCTGDGCGRTGGGTAGGEAPLPATLPLFASGLGLVGWFSRRRRRQAAA